MRHCLHTINATILLVLIGTVSPAYSESDPSDPAEALRNSVDKIADAILVDLDAARKPVSKVDASRLIVTLLNAGRCDEAYRRMLSVPGESFQLYCRAMAEAGRADEVSKNVKDFQNSLSVKRLMTDEELSFEQLYTIPLLHGKALHWVSQGKFESAMEELQTLNGMQRFGGEFDRVAVSVILAIHRKAGAKACLTAIEKHSNGHPEKLKGMIRRVVMKLSTEELLAVIRLLPDEHSRTYLWEMSLIFNNDQIEESDKRLAIDDALLRMNRLRKQDTIALKSQLLTSHLISTEKKGVFAEECFAWVMQNRSDIAFNRFIFSWLVSQSKWGQIESMISSMRDTQQRVIVIGQLVRVMEKGSPPESVDRVAAWLPNAAEASSVKRVDESIPDFLIEAGKLTLAEEWLPKVEDGDEQQALRQKVEFYRVLGMTKFADTKVISAALTAIDKKLSASTRPTFHKILGTDFLAEIAVRAGAKTALAVARNLSVDPQVRPNPVGNCASALLNRGETALAFEVLELGTSKETQSALLIDVDFDKMKPEDRRALKSKLAPFFPNDAQFIQIMIREAISSGDKPEAFELVEKCFRLSGTPLWLNHRFAHRGWHEELVELASKIESQESKKNNNLKGMTNECVKELAWSLLIKADQAGPTVTAFVKEHVRSQQDRIEIYLDITSEDSLSK